MVPAQRSHVRASRRTIATHSTGRLRRPSAALAVALLARRARGLYAGIVADLCGKRGSGTRFDPGSCDPAAHAPVIDAPQPPDTRALWLGPRYRGLLLTRAERKGRHAPRLRLRVVRPPQLPAADRDEPPAACRLDTFRGLLDGG
jgi:hypothetical protein